MNIHSKYLENYKIEGTINFDQNEAFHQETTYPEFQSQLFDFKKWLIDNVNQGKPTTIYKFGDGDFHFLTKSRVGSAQPGRRALSKDYNQMTNHHEFIDGVCKNDVIAVEIYNHSLFHQIYPTRKIDIPAEYGYGLIANRWLTKTFSNQIGLIGASEKLDLIKELMKKQEYRNFLGLDHFNDYIKIPQKFACDNLEELVQSTLQQLRNCKSETKIFLVGIGHVKSGLLHRLKEEKNATFYDIGSGIDALAGIIDCYRPYMGAWTNYKISNYDYSKIDFLQYTPIPEKEKWLV